MHVIFNSQQTNSTYDKFIKKNYIDTTHPTLSANYGGPYYSKSTLLTVRCIAVVCIIQKSYCCDLDAYKITGPPLVR